jgi:hypothetical protein
MLNPAPAADNGVVDDLGAGSVPTASYILRRMHGLCDLGKTAKRFRKAFFGEVLEAPVVPAEERLRKPSIHRHNQIGKQMVERLCTRDDRCLVVGDGERFDKLSEALGNPRNIHIRLIDHYAVKFRDLAGFGLQRRDKGKEWLQSCRSRIHPPGLQGSVEALQEHLVIQRRGR